jgi:hypothetical protein
VSTPLRSARLLPDWVLELRGDRRANVALAADVADAVFSLGDADVPVAVRRRLTAMIERADKPVRVSPYRWRRRSSM